MPTRLEQIIQSHREAAAKDHRIEGDLIEQALRAPKPRNFRAALQSHGVSVISEVKRRSPSAGDLNLDLDPVSLAQQYAAGGAACLSVLTDVEYFGGSIADLQAARAAVTVPVLRKDFTVDARDVADARVMGADAVLLIVAALSDAELVTFAHLARDLELTALFEVHDRNEVERALAAGADVVGVNQRNLHTFEIDRDLAMTLAAAIPDTVVRVAESGIRGAEDVRLLAEAGYDAVLVGTSIVTAGDAKDAVAALVAAGSK